MKILVLGGNRFAGKLVVERLHNLGHDITVFNRSGTSPVPCNIIKGDRNNEICLKNALTDMSFDYIIDMCLYNEQQAKKSIPVFDKITKKYIFISSVAVYEKSDLFPITESFNLGPWELFGNYGTEKANVEKYLSSFDNLVTIVLRPSYIIGKNNHHNREGYYFDKIISEDVVDVEGDGQAVLSFVFVEDLANIIINFVMSKDNLAGTYNICGDEYTTIKGFINLISGIVGKKPSLKTVNEAVSFKNENCFFSNSKVKNILNYKFKNLSDGLKELYEHSYKVP